MNTNSITQYQGLLNQNIGTSMDCDEINATEGNIDYITCIDLTSTGNITANNIGATAITTDNINADTGEFTGVLLATENVGSTISRANQIATTASTTNTNFPITFSSSGGGYKDILNSTTLTYNPSTQLMNVSALTATGLFTATNDASSIVSNSNAVYTVGVTSGSYYVPLISNSGGTGYRNLYNKSSITYDMTNDIFNCGKAQLTLGDWNTDDPSLVLGTSDGNKEGVLEIIASATTSYLLEGTPSGNFELYYKLSGTSYLLYQITSSVYNVYADMNLSTGKSYKINGVALNTDNIQESGTPTNLYFTNARSRSSITPTNTTEINHTYSTSTGVLTSNINATSVTNSMLAGSIANSKLTNSSITLGSSSMSLGSTYTTVAGMTSLTSTGLTASGGVASSTVSLATPSLSLGTVSSNHGVLKLYTAINTSYAIIQKTGVGLDIDTSDVSASIGIGRNTPTYIYIGDATKSIYLYGAINFIDSRPTYAGGSFNGFSTIRYSTFATTAFSATNTNWYPMREGTSGNNLKLTYSGLTSDIIELKVRLSGAYNSSTGQYMYFDIHKGTQPAAQTASTQVSLVTNTTATSAGWGAHLIGPNVYQGVHFSIVYTFTANESTTFFPVFRTQTTASCALGSATANLNPYAEFSIQRIF